MLFYLIKQLLPYPQDGDCADDAEDEVSEIAFAKQLDIQQIADESTSIAAYDSYDKIHTTTLALTAHNAVCYVANEDTCEYRPRRKICNVLKH